MFIKPMKLGLTFITVIVGSGASAQDNGGYYVKGAIGLSSLQGSEIDIDGTETDLSYDSDILAGGAVGYDYANSPFRSEIEFFWRTGAAQDLTPSVGSGGEYASTSLMLNGYYLIDTGSDITPYVGAGIGYVTEIDFDIDDASGADEFSETGLLGYQFMAGAEIAVTDQVALFGEARYFNADNPALSEDGGSTLRADYATLDIVAGVIWSF